MICENGYCKYEFIPDPKPGWLGTQIQHGISCIVKERMMLADRHYDRIFGKNCQVKDLECN